MKEIGLLGEYLEHCQRVLEQMDINIVPSVSPNELTLIDSAESVLFDPAVPADMQLQLTGLHRRSTDGYDKIIGALRGRMCDGFKRLTSRSTKVKSTAVWIFP